MLKIPRSTIFQPARAFRNFGAVDRGRSHCWERQALQLPPLSLWYDPYSVDLFLRKALFREKFGAENKRFQTILVKIMSGTYLSLLISVLFEVGISGRLWGIR